MNNDRYYTGSTNNIERRYRDHSLGRVKSTKAHRPLKLIYTKIYTSIVQARQVEYRLKQMKDRSCVEKFISGELDR